MSVLSMTGHGCGQATGHGVAVSVVMGSVNRKNLDLMVQLPRGLQQLDAEIQGIVRGSVSRGRVTVHITVDWAGGSRSRAVRLDEERAAAYLEVLNRAAQRLGVENDVGLKSLIQLPDVLHVAEPDEDVAAVHEVLEKALRKALTQFTAMRRREGLVLQRDILERLKQMEEHTRLIRDRAQQFAPLYRQRLLERLEAVGAAQYVDQDRLIREVALYADRADITEELTRLDSHVKQARRMLRSKEATGRSLDFLSQEMLREINTIGSKANDTPILQRVVELKSEVERIREQVQNIE